jgi:hypothetical protein
MTLGFPPGRRRRRWKRLMRTAQRWISVAARARPRTVTAGGEPGLPAGLPVGVLEAAAAGKSRPTGGPRRGLIPGHRNTGVHHQALVPLLGRRRGRLRVWGVMMGGTAVKGPLLTLFALIALCVSSITAAASRPLGHCHMAAQHFTVESGVMMMVVMRVAVRSRMDELVLVKRDGRLGKIVRRGGAAPAAAAAPTAAPAPVPARRVVHNHDGAVDVAARTAGFAAGLPAAACAAAAAGAHAAAVRMLLLLLRMVVVVVVMVGQLLLLLAVLVVLREHRCRCCCCAIAITFTLPTDGAPGSERRRRRGRFRSTSGGGVAVLPAAPVGTAATLSAGGKTHVFFYRSTAYSRLPIGISLIALILLLLLFK